VHLETFPEIPSEWRDEALAAKWAKVRRVRSVVTGALEIERANKKIGSSLEAAPQVFVAEAGLLEALQGVDLAEVCITSDIAVLARSAAGPRLHLAGCGSGSASCRTWQRVRNARGPGASPGMSAATRLFRPCPRAMRPRCANSMRASARARLSHDAGAQRQASAPALAVGSVLRLWPAGGRAGGCIDQAHKWWMLAHYDIESRGRVAVLPFLDLVYVKNLGVSYGLFLQDGPLGQWLLAGFAIAAALAMTVWLARGMSNRLVAGSVGSSSVVRSAMPSIA
jgi:hypothetical protein